jgi:hydrogenase maturation factor
MCLAIPGKIIEKEGKKVKVDYDGDVRDANVIEGDYSVGDFVIVQGHIVIEKVPVAQVSKWKQFLKDGS